MTQEKLLIIEDEQELAGIIEEVAVDCGYDVTVASTAQQIESSHHTCQPDLIIMDLLMPEMDGIEVMQYLRQAFSRAQIIILSGSAPESRQMAQRLGQALGLAIIANLAKPIRVAELRHVLNQRRTAMPRQSTSA